ncbi:portal protein [Geobacillus phage TP-84]|uniref:Capsid portal protein n=1 Tax=Geobacillus phage TP-84 TaxID=1965361 RepID=A0A1U9WQP5_9CAUD|nr:portal protein [Geobacillus phage TP-84]AQY55104.1 portal protein [Geobacillus phage TP-84]
MGIKWTKWSTNVIKKYHGNIQKYRKLYDGDHAKLFERAKRLIQEGEITDQIIEGAEVARNVKTPYIVANVCKMIVDIPAMLVSRAIGQVTTSMSPDDFAGMVTDQGDGTVISLYEKQKELIKGIAKRSNLQFEHKTNIIHHQMDGGIVGMPFDDENGLRIEFKSRDVYYPHPDGRGCDLVYQLEIEDEETEEAIKYLHVYRERVEEQKLVTQHMLYKIGESGMLEEIEDEAEVKEILGIEKTYREFEGRDKPFVVYWPNNKTFTHPLGRSELYNLAGKQDEINWTLTRNAIVYERNGKPRIAVSKEIFQALQDKAFERYGDENKIDHRDLEIVTFDENGKAMEVIQIDVSKIGDIKWVKDLMKLMLMETHTSEKAVDFYLEGNTSAQSGIAKFYDLFVSIMKAEQIATEYVHFLQELFENCLWIAHQDDPDIVIEEPRIQIKDMIPISRRELIEQESTAYKNGTQSLETTVRNQNPTATEDWIEDELAAIEESQQSTDTTSILMGRQTLSNLLDNRNPNGTPIGAAQQQPQQGTPQTGGGQA